MTGPETPAGPHVRVWRQPDGLWRWRYVEPGPGGEPRLTLAAHKAFETVDEARDSAVAAYPGIELQYEKRADTDTDAAAGGRPPLWLVVAVVVLLLVIRRRMRRADQPHRRSRHTDPARLVTPLHRGG